MTEKEKRLEQLEKLKEGIFPGSYYTEVVSFDGRIICRNKWESEHDCIIAYFRYKKAWSGSASVRRYVQIDF